MESSMARETNIMKEKKEQFILNEMDLCRQYCSAIHKERQNNGFISLKYPLISVKVNRYFLPEYQEIIADECNLIGYMDIPAVELYEDVKYYDTYLEDGEIPKIEILLNCTKSDWQQELAEKREEKRKEAEKRKTKV